MPATKTSTPKAASTRKRSTKPAKAKAPRGKVGAPKPKSNGKLSPVQEQQLKDWHAHEVARDKDRSIPVDVGLMQTIKNIKPGYDFDAEAKEADARTEGKGYDPAIPADERTPSEKEATLAALNNPDAGKEKPAAKGRGSGKKKGKKGRGFLDCAMQVLREADGPMKTKEIMAVIQEKKMTTTTGGKTPAAALYVQLHQAAFKRAEKTIVRTDPNTWDLKELNPKGAKRRPAKKGS